MDSGDKLFQNLLMLLVVPVTALWSGYVLSVMWAWFIVPLGAVSIGVWHAFGISVLVDLLTFKQPQEKVDDSKRPSPGVRIATSLFVPLIVLGFGWAAHAMMVLP